MNPSQGSGGGQQQQATQHVAQITQALGISVNDWNLFVRELRTNDGLKTFFENGERSNQMVYNKILDTVPAGQPAGASGSSGS